MPFRVITIGTLVICLGGCSSGQVRDATFIGKDVLSACPPADRDDYFFSPPTFADDGYDGAD